MDFIADPMAVVLAGFYAVIPVLGVGIVLLTLLARLILLPLGIKQTKSMREMQVIQPEVKRIQAKFKNDPQRRNEETMRLYKEHGVNPLGGCLPLLAQFPVFIGLFYVVRDPQNYVPAGSALAAALDSPSHSVFSFLGVLDLSLSLSDVWAISPVEAIPYVLLLGLMGVTTFFQSRQMQTSRGANDPQAQQMQIVTKVLPVMLVVFGIGFPAGVVLYWVTTNAWTIVQQRIILGKFGPPPGAAAPPKATGTKAKGGDNGAKTQGGGKAPRTGKSGQRPRESKSPSNGQKRSPTASKKKKKR